MADMNSPEHWAGIHKMWADKNTAAVRAAEMAPAWEALSPLFPLTGNVVDIGCSSGGFLEFLSRREGGDLLMLYGCDLDPLPITIAQARIPGAILSVVNVLREPLPWADAWFDRVFSGHLIEHLADPTVLLREMARIVKPEGRVIVEFPFGDPPYPEHVHHLLDYDKVGAWVMASGLEIVECRPVIEMNPTNDGVIVARRV